jgi:hypothetical protein
MKSINIIQASRLVLKGGLDVTPTELSEGIMIGKGLYYEETFNEKGIGHAWTDDIYLVNDEYEPDL